jgi:hypothetical protein
MLLRLRTDARDACEADDDSAALIAVREVRRRVDACGRRQNPFRESTQLVRVEVRGHARRACAVNVFAHSCPPARAASEQRVDLFVEAFFHL